MGMQNKRDLSRLTNKNQEIHQQLKFEGFVVEPASENTLESHSLDHPDFSKERHI